MAPRLPYCFSPEVGAQCFRFRLGRQCEDDPGVALSIGGRFLSVNCVGCRGGSEHPDSDFLVVNSAMQNFSQTEEDRQIRIVAQHAAYQAACLTHNLTRDGD
jgi:hypothetical protein